jgi:hypothetical protein
MLQSRCAHISIGTAATLGELQTEKTKEATISLTRDFQETIRERVQRDSKFRKELL